jgi:hypothetical protein
MAKPTEATIHVMIARPAPMLIQRNFGCFTFGVA